MKLIIHVFFLSLVSQVVAQENPLLDTVLKRLDLNQEKIEKEFTVIKQFPYDTNKYICLVALPIEEEGYTPYDVYLLLVDRTGEIICKYFEKEALVSDAVRLTGVTIDTAPYDVAPGVRAFGITSSHYLQSRPNPYSGRSLSLFIRQDSGFVKILDDFEVQSYQGDGNEMCESTYWDEQNILIMLKNQTDGFNDILIKSKEKVTEHFLVGEDCEERETVKKTSYKLIYSSLVKSYQREKASKD